MRASARTRTRGRRAGRTRRGRQAGPRTSEERTREAMVAWPRGAK
jgi:hypothetical protein